MDSELINRLIGILEQAEQTEKAQQVESFLSLIDSDPDIPFEVKEAFASESASDLMKGLNDVFFEVLNSLFSQDSEGFPTIEHYQIITKLGSGGMGSVYLAHENEPVNRLVAVKMLHSDQTPQALARFNLEHKTMVLLNHPNLVKLITIGNTQKGDPFYVMEYVPGINIAKFVEKDQLNVAEIVALTIQVCDAVHHAHQKGIVHRDLKPANVLVHHHWNNSTVKVLDFGVAQMAARTLFTGDAVQTLAGALIGTPAYMAPEQALTDGSDIDIRADIFGIGALFYRLLTGTAPLDTSNFQKMSIDEVVDTIKNHQMEAPSLRVARGKANHYCSAKDLRGDLDWIVSKAMAKEPRQRYDSLSAMIEDLKAYLAKRPVKAAPDSLRYRWGKFVQRHKAAVVWALMAFLCLIVGSGLAFRGHLDSQRASLRAVALARIAADEAEKFRAVNQFLLEMISMADPFTNNKGDMKVSEMLTHVASVFDRRFADQPLTKAEVEDALGKSFIRLRHFDEAEHQCLGALKARETILGPSHQKSLESKIQLADLRWLQKQYHESRALYQSVIDLGQANTETTLQAEVKLIHRDREQAQYKLAEQAYRSILPRLNQVLGKDHVLVMDAKHGLAATLGLMSSYAEAISLYREVLAYRERTGKADSVSTLTIKQNLATALSGFGRLDEARQLQAEVYRLHVSVLGETDSRTAAVLANLASIEFELGKYDEAEKSTRTALHHLRRVLGEEHELTIKTENTLSLILHAKGQYAASERLFHELYRLIRARDSADHPLALLLAHNWAFALVYMGKLNEAQQILTSNCQRLSEKWGNDDPLMALYMFTLGQLHLRRGSYELAEEAFSRAYSLSSNQHLPEDHYQLLFIRAFLGYSMLKKGQEQGRAYFISASAALGMHGLYPDQIKMFAKELGISSEIKPMNLENRSPNRE